MRTLSPTLLAAQKAASAVPFVQVKIRDRLLGVPRLRWEELYSGAEADRYHGAAIPADGSLLRARVDPAGPTLLYQRTASPGPGAAFGTWADFGSAADAGVALAAAGTKAVLASVASNGTDILVRDSSDSGATFGPGQAAVRLASAVGWVAIAMRSDGGALLVFSVGSAVYSSSRTGSVWTMPSAWPHSATAIAGLAVTHAGDYHLAIAGVDSGGASKVWTAVYGDGFAQASGTWSALMELASADVGSAVSLRAPSLTVVDSHRLFFVEEYGGTVAYSRPHWTWFPAGQSFVANAWREPVPFDVDASYGVAIASGGGFAWLSAPFGVWRAALAPAEADVSDDVLELASESDVRGGRVRIVLRNDDGRYSGLPDVASGIGQGAELAISPGYVTSAGAEVSSGPRYWIDGWEYASEGGSATLSISGRDAWSLVSGWRARRQYVWPAGTESVFEILRFVLGRAGLELISVGGSALSGSHKPAFTVHPGVDGREAVDRLLALTPDQILVSGSIAVLFEPLASDSAVYAYGGDHGIAGGRYTFPRRESNRIQVFGEGIVAEEFDWGDISAQFDRLRQVHDLNITSVELAQGRASAALRREELVQARGEIVTPVNCGQELHDVVSVTDPHAGLASATYRVTGLRLRYSRRGRRPVYEQRVLLGPV